MVGISGSIMVGGSTRPAPADTPAGQAKIETGDERSKSYFRGTGIPHPSRSAWLEHLPEIAEAPSSSKTEMGRDVNNSQKIP